MNDALLVKICGITNEADALLAVGLGADAVGFVLAPSPRQVTATTAADIAKRLPRDVLTVGVFRDEAPARVVEIANRAGLGAVQLHGHETAEETRWVAARVACTIRAFSAGNPAIGQFAESGADYLLVDGESPGSGSVFDWRLAEGVVDMGRMLVSGGLHPGNVAEAIAHLRPRGVDVCSGVESSLGRKDPQKLRAFIRVARDAAAEASRSRRAPGWAAPGGRGQGEPAGGGEGEPAGAGPYDWMAE